MSRSHPLQVSINGMRARSFHLAVPDAIDTLAELCRYISEELPLPGPVHTRKQKEKSGGASERFPTSGRGYRFLYSLSGEPLWRVAECLELGHVVASEVPGFIEVEEKQSTPQYLVKPSSRPHPSQNANGEEVGSNGSSSSLSSSSTRGSSHSSTEPARPHLISSWATSLSTSAHQEQTRPPPLPHTVTGTTRGKQRSRSAVGGGSAGTPPSMVTRRPSTSREMSAPRGLSTSPSPMRPVPQPPLQHQSDPISFLSNTETVVLDPRINSSPTPQSSFSTSRTAPLRAAAPTPRMTSEQKHSRNTLREFSPAIPVVFTPNASSPAVFDWNITSCEMLLARKWRAFQSIRHKTDLLARAEVQQRLEVIARQRKGVEPGTPLRIVVSGPPGSGVSTTAAMLVQEILQTRVEHQKQNSFCGYLLLPLDLPLLLRQDLDSTADNVVGQTTERGETPLLFWCEMLLHSVVDAVVAGRRQLHLTGAVLVEFWMSILCPTGPPSAALRIRQDAVAMVGEDIVREWEFFAQQGSHLLREAGHGHASFSHSDYSSTVDSSTIRDAALQFIFRDIPILFAQSMKFVGVFYVVDGLERLCRGSGTLHRPLGDLTPVLKSICDRNQTAHVHAIICFSERSLHPALSTSYISGLTSWIKTIGLLPMDRFEASGIPQHIHCFEDTFPVEIFLGAPGYLAAVHRYCGMKEHYARNKGACKSTCARIDFSNVQQELKQLQSQIELFIDRRVS